MKRTGFVVACSLLMLAAFAMPVSADSFEKLREILNRAMEKLDEFEAQISAKSNSSSELVGRVIRQGYDHFESSSTVSKVNNLDSRFYDNFVAMQMRRLKMPQADLQDIKESVFDKLKNAEQGEWLVHKIIYNPEDDQDSTKYICVFGHRNARENFDMFIVEVKAKFELARNLLIVQNKKTGQLSTETEEIEKERLPEGAQIDSNDVQLLLNFFEAIALRVANSRV